jgi:ssRNA-specific RNase YbeY (16S rRNA maturation enzyme)
MIALGCNRLLRVGPRSWAPAVSRQLHVFPVNPIDENVTSKYGINIKNSQSEFQIDCDALLETIDGIRSVLGYSDHRIDVWLCSDSTMSKYNTLWRGPKKHVAVEDDETEDNAEASAEPVEDLPVKHGRKDSDGRQVGRVRKTSVTARRTKPATAKPQTPVLNSTDILSFPALDFSSPGVRIVGAKQTPDGLETEKHLGDIMVSAAYIHRQCMKDRKMDEDGYEFDFDDDEVGVFRAMSSYFKVQERLPLLLVHGCVHLLGYDHETDGEWRVMTQREEQVIQQLGLTPPPRLE